MQSGNLNVKIVQRKLQSNTSSFQYMLLAGFTPSLSHTTPTTSRPCPRRTP